MKEFLLSVKEAILFGNKAITRKKQIIEYGLWIKSKSGYRARKSGSLTIPQNIIRDVRVIRKKGLHNGKSKSE